MQNSLSVAEKLLRQKVEEQADRIATLEGMLSSHVSERLPIIFRLTTKEEDFLRVLMRCHEPSWGMIIEDLWPQASQESGHNLAKCFLHKVRAKLNPYGIQIERRWGYGPYLTRENKEKLKEIIKREAHV